MSSEIAFRRALEVLPHMGDEVVPWPDILRTASDLIGSDGAVFIIFEGSELRSMQQFGAEPAAVSDYALHFYQHDILLDPSCRRTPGTWLDTQNFLTPAERSKNVYYVDFMSKHRMRHLMSFVVQDTTARTATIGFQRDLPSDTIRDRLYGGAIANYTRALQDAVAHRLDRGRGWFRNVDSAFSALGEAVCVATTQGKILHESVEVRELLKSNCGLSIRLGQLWHPSEVVRASLFSALNRAARPASRVVRLSVSGIGNAPARCLIEMGRANLSLRLGSEPLVLLRLSLRIGPSVNQASLETICEHFGLTVAEGRVLAALLSGNTPTSHALSHGTSVHTVRKQIATIMGKMGCSRQVDLIRAALAAL